MGIQNKLKTQGKRWLRKNHANQHPSNLLFFDCESRVKERDPITGREDQVLHLGVAKAVRVEKGKETRKTTCWFSSPAELFAFIRERLHPKLPLWCFAHNLSVDLAWGGFWARLRNGTMGFTLNEVAWEDGCKPDPKRTRWKGLYIDTDPPLAASVWHKSGAKIYFVDTRNYIPASVAEIGDAVGLPKLEDPGEHGDIKARAEYCERDVDIIKSAMLSFMWWHKMNNLGNWGLTLASMSMKAYRHRFKPCGIELHDDRHAKELERKALRGGRNEVLKPGEIYGDIVELDVNNCYGYLMRECHFPCELIDCYSWHGSWRLDPTQLSYDYIAEVGIETNEPIYPVYREDRGLFFPTGKFTTTLCGPELAEACKRGDVKRVGRWARYECRKLFRKYVDFFTEAREHAEKSGNPIMRRICKSLVVSLFGKFAQKSPKWVSLEKQPKLISDPLASPGDFDRKWEIFTRTLDGERFLVYDDATNYSTVIRRIGNHYQRRAGFTEPPDAFPAIPAYITSWGRAYLTTLSSLVSEGEIYYRCTDSLVCNNVALDELESQGMVHPTNLGKLKIKQRAPQAYFGASNYYIVGNSTRRSGVKANATVGPDGIVTQQEFSGMKALAQSKTPHVVSVKTVRKAFLHRLASKGTLGNDGWLSPIVLDEVA